MTDAAEGYAALADAAQGYVEAHAYHDGTVSEVFGSRVVQRRLANQGRPFRVNVIKSVVDARADRLELVGVTLAEKDTAASAELVSIMEANGIEFESGNVHRRACEFGDFYVMVWPEVDESGTQTGVVVNSHSPLGMRVVYDPDNPRRKRYAVQSWEVETPAGQPNHWRVNLYYPDRVERWATKPGSKPTDVDGWVESPETDDPDSWVTENPYGEVPVFHFRNGTPYGKPVHIDGYGAQDALTKLVTSHMSTVDYHIVPQRYALTEPGNIDDDLDLDDDPEFDTLSVTERETGQRRGGIEGGPGTIQYFENVKAVGTFDVAKSETFTGPAAFYVKLMAQTTKTPLDMLDDSGDEPSGESRRRKDAPLRDAVRTLAKMFGQTWADVFRFALKVADHPDATVKVSFAPYEVVSDAEGWATIREKISNGVPVRVALIEAGYSEDQVDEWFPEDEENRLRVTDLVDVADVLQKLAAAVAMNLLSEEEARALLPEGILPDRLVTAPAPALPSLPEE